MAYVPCSARRPRDKGTSVGTITHCEAIGESSGPCIDLLIYITEQRIKYGGLQAITIVPVVGVLYRQERDICFGKRNVCIDKAEVCSTLLYVSNMISYKLG